MIPTLHPYQVEGARFLSAFPVALLADEPGLGKTAQAIEACRQIGARTVVVVCPASLRENWRREFARWWPDSGVNLIVESYDMVARGRLAGIGNFDVLILDEAHYLKSRKAKRTTALLGKKCDCGEDGIAAWADHVFALTGTPTPNNPSELWPLLHALAPGLIKGRNGWPRNFHSFTHRYCVVRNNGFGEVIVGGRNLDELKRVIEPFVLRRLKADVLQDLPEITWDHLYLAAPDVRLPTEVLHLLPEIETALDEHGVAGLAKIAEHVATLRRYTGIAKAGLSADWIRDWLEGSGGRKIVAFAHHADVLDIVEDDLRATGIAVATIRGSTPAEKRQAAVDAFQTDPDCRVFLGQIQAAGTGITLTAASDVLFIESSWVPAENEQAAMRVHRIGQDRGCVIRFATLAGSIDERIQAAVMRKTRDIEELFG